jgi:competence protein ComEC
MKHFFRIEDKRVMVLDHQSINTDFGFKPDVLILMNSPKVNLERLLKEVHPEIIVADGSNYFSYKLLWKITAEKHKINFYDTAKMGAFVM